MSHGYESGRLNLPFVGIATFAKKPYIADWDAIEADVAILGAPFENQDVFARWRGPVTPEKTRILAQFPGKKLNKLTYLATDLTWSWTIQSNGQRMVVVEAK